jgi:hypothetical protein
MLTPRCLLESQFPGRAGTESVDLWMVVETANTWETSLNSLFINAVGKQFTETLTNKVTFIVSKDSTNFQTGSRPLSIMIQTDWRAVYVCVSLL